MSAAQLPPSGPYLGARVGRVYVKAPGGAYYMDDGECCYAPERATRLGGGYDWEAGGPVDFARIDGYLVEQAARAETELRGGGLDALVREYDRWRRVHELPHCSAEEMLAGGVEDDPLELSHEQRLWLMEFISRWDAAWHRENLESAS